MSDAITSRKLERWGGGGADYLGQPMLFKLNTWLAAFRVRCISVLSIC